jgi:hypothetical protein
MCHVTAWAVGASNAGVVGAGRCPVFVLSTVPFAARSSHFQKRETGNVIFERW